MRRIRNIFVCLIVLCIILAISVLSSCSNEETKAFNQIQKNYEQENMQNVIDDINLFKENYPDSSYTEEVNELAKSAEKYIADHFEPVEEKYYKNYIGVLDFGAYSGLPLSETCDEKGPFVYINVKDYMLIHYVESLKEKGFEDDGLPSYALGLVGIETNDTIYLKNAKYQVQLMYDPDIGMLGLGVY